MRLVDVGDVAFRLANQIDFVFAATFCFQECPVGLPKKKLC
jgi:hypothetical protein